VSARELSYPRREFVGYGLSKPTLIERLYQVEQDFAKLTPEGRITHENFSQQVKPYDDKMAYLQYYGDSTKWQMTLMQLEHKLNINRKQLVASYIHERQEAFRNHGKSGTAHKRF